MANIKPYEAPQGIGLSPTETGIETIAGNARRMGAYGNQIADTFNQEGKGIASTVTDVGSVVENYMTHRDISKGAADGAQFVSGMNDLWNQQAANADPNDPTIKQKFMQDQLEPALEKFKGNFSTERSQQWAEHFVDSYRQHMTDKTDADMSTLAGIAVRKNVATTVNSLSSAVASDPSSLDFALASVDHSIGAMVASNPNLKATDAAAVSSEIGLKAKENIVKSAISGMITKNPNVDLDAIQKKYGDYINGAEMKMFQRAAQVQAKGDLLQTKQLETYQRQQQERAANDAFTKSRAENMSADENGNLTINPKMIKDALDITRKYPEAGTGALDTTIRFVESQHNKELKVTDDPIVKSDLMTRMFSADKPTTAVDLMKARAEGKISDHTFQAYHGLLQELEQTPLKGQVWQDTAAAVKGELVLSNIGLPGKDIKGEGNYAKWAQTFIPQYLAKSRSGTLEPNALDVKDPKSMISQSMAPFHRSVSQRTQDYLSSLGVDDKGIPRSTPTVITKEAFDALKSGETYVGADGKTYRKP